MVFKFNQFGFTFGFINDLIIELQSRLNFSVLLYKHQIEQWGFIDLLPNGTLHGSGIVGDVFYKRVDMAVAPLSIIYRRALYIDYLPPVVPDFVGIFIPTVDEMINLNTFHLPYSPRLWMVIFDNPDRSSAHLNDIALHSAHGGAMKMRM